LSWLEGVVTGFVADKMLNKLVDYLADVLGVEKKQVNDPGSKCPYVLQVGLTPNVCKDFIGIRRWVLCRTWQLLKEHKYSTFRDAIREAWKEAHEKCGGLL